MAKESGFSFMKLLVTLIVLAALVGGVFWFSAKRGEQSPQYQTTVVSRGEVISAVTANGTLNPVLNVLVGSQVSGRISRLYADFNSIVKSNQIVAEIDSSTYQASLQRAEADLMSARASLELSQVEARRAEQLFTNKLISASEHDSTIASLHQAEASMQIRQAAVESAKVDLSRCTIYAPVDGVVLSRSVDVGQTVAASMSAPELFRIANDLAKMQINANVSEADIGTVEEGQPVTFTVDAFPDRKFTGRVVQIRNSPTTVQNVVTYDCVIEVSNPDLKLRPGMTANADIIIAQRENVLKIPNAAFRFRPTEPSTNKTLFARLFGGGEAKKPATAVTPATLTTSTNKTDVAGGEAPLTGNEPPEELQKRVGEMRARGDEIPQEITDKLRDYYQSGVLQRGAGGGGRGGRGGGGGGRRGGGGGFGAGMAGGARGAQPSTRTVYILAAGTDSSNPMPQAVRIRTGISDGTNTEITDDGLKEGDVLIIGLKQQTPVTGAMPGGAASPFGGGGGRGGGRGF